MASTMAAAPAARSNIGPITIVGVLFFIFGFATWLNGPLITFVKAAFNVSDVVAFLVPLAFYLSYFFLALPSSAILKRTGMKRGMALGLFVMAVGAVLFGRFAVMHVLAGALVSLFVIGAGMSLLQTATNPYVSILGPIESGAQRMAIMGICNKFAGILAPIVIGTLVLAGIGGLGGAAAASMSAADHTALVADLAGRINVFYEIMAVVLVLFGIGVMYSSLPELKPSDANDEHAIGHAGRSILSFPHLWLGVLCLFLYVGVEVMAGDAIGTYGAGFGLPTDQTKFFTSFTLGAMLLGYFAGLVLIPRFVSQQRYLAVSAVLGVVFALAAYVTHGYASVLCVAALGFANAMMWPAIFPLAIKGLGSHTEVGSAFLIMGIAGGALVPQAFVHLKEVVNFQLAFAVLVVPCYLYILFYGLRGHRVGQHPAS